MTVETLPVEVALDARARIAECPVWDPDEHVLWWVDIPQGQVHRFDPQSTRAETIDVGEDVGAIAPRAAGGLVLALRSGFAVLETSGLLRPIATFDGGDRRLRLNDGRCDARGRFWAGTVRDDQAPGSAALYRLDPDGQVSCQLDGVTISNGLDWSPDDRVLYYADSGTRTVDAFVYDVERGTIGGRQRFIQLDPEEGFPDGLCVDTEGYVWVAVFYSWTVRRYAPDGRLDRLVRLPVRDVTSCAFGGVELDVLYVTSASERLRPEDWPAQPQAGGLFRCRPRARGRRQHPWGG